MWVSVGLLFDMMCESGNDNQEYATIASQGDMDAF